MTNRALAFLIAGVLIVTYIIKLIFFATFYLAILSAACIIGVGVYVGLAIKQFFEKD